MDAKVNRFYIRRPECRRMPRAAIARSRAPTMFSVRIKSASVQKTWLWIKARAVWGGFYTRSPIACGCAFHPRAIGDPRGRDAVRASAEDYSSAQHRYLRQRER